MKRGREGRSVAVVRSVERVGEIETDCGCSVCVVRSAAELVVFSGGEGWRGRRWCRK